MNWLAIKVTKHGQWVQTNVVPDPRAGYLAMFERVYAGSQRRAVVLNRVDEGEGVFHEPSQFRRTPAPW